MKTNLSNMDMITYNEKKKSKIAAYLLWFFLGGFGAHQFYLGNIKTGVFYICLWAFYMFSYLMATGMALSGTRVIPVVFLPSIILSIIFAVLLIKDAFLVYKKIEKYNERILSEIASNSSNTKQLM